MNENGLVYAYLFDGEGGARAYGWEEIKTWSPDQGVLWLHFDYTSPKAKDWIINESNLDEISKEALLTEETRPRATVIDNAFLIALRGVNLSPGSEPEDMVAIRIWADEQRIISTRKRKLLSASDIADLLEKGQGPTSSEEFVVNITSRLISRMAGTIEEMEDRLDVLEEEVLTNESYSLRSGLAEIRREAIMLRRYLNPQKDAMTRLVNEKVKWIEENSRMLLREVTDQLIRHIEDLDLIRDRAAVTQEELANRLAEQMNVRMYVLSLVAAIFLPLGFLTGLLGINVGGIPGAENNWSFIVFTTMLIFIVVFQILFFKKKKWM